MFRAIWRQRRLSLFATFFLPLYVFMLFGGEVSQTARPGLSQPVAIAITAATFLILALGQAIILSALILLLPSLRAEVEVLALTLFCFATVMLAVPASVVAAVPLLNFLIIIMLAFTLPQLL